jgi:hypothetical protein
MLSSRVQAIVSCVIASLLGRDVAFAKSFAVDARVRRCERCHMKNIMYPAMPPDVAVIEPRFFQPRGTRICSSRKSRLPVTLSWRGGAIPDLQTYFSASKARCWFALLLAILIDTASTALMKAASDEGSSSKLALSYFGSFIR